MMFRPRVISAPMDWPVEYSRSRSIRYFDVNSSTRWAVASKQAVGL